MPIDIAAVRARKKPRRVPVTIILDPDLEAAFVDAQAAQAEAQDRVDRQPSNSAAAGDLAAANESLATARVAAKAESVTFVFQALGREAFEELRGEHPPTKAQRDDYKAKALAMGMAPYQAGELAHNPETFPPVLIAASCIEPVMTVEDAQGMWGADEFSNAELADLFSAALMVNQTSRRVDLGNG